MRAAVISVIRDGSPCTDSFAAAAALCIHFGCSMSTSNYRRSVVRSAFVASSLALSAFANHGPGTSGGGSSTESGETLRAGKLAISFRTDITQYESVSTAEAEQKAIAQGAFDGIERTLVESVSLAYGVTDDFQVGATTGYYWGHDFIDAEADGLGGAESATADPNGLIDLWLNAKWRVMHGASGHLALIGGVKLPTGDDNEKLSNGEKLEPSSQPGTGAVDWQLGVAYSRYLSSRITLDASGVYTLRGEHDDFEVGDRFDAGLALAYRLTDDVRAFPNYSVSGELLGNWLDKDQDHGVDNDASGGTSAYLAVGFRARFNDVVSLGVAPALPIAQDLNGDQVEAKGKLAVVLALSL
jgi:hypothetical protein